MQPTAARSPDLNLVTAEPTRNALHDFMAGNAWVNGGYESAPLVASLVEIGVADTAEEDFDLHVVFSWIAPRDRGGGQRRRWTGGGISFGVVHMPIRGVRLMFGYAKFALVILKRSNNALRGCLRRISHR